MKSLLLLLLLAGCRSAPVAEAPSPLPSLAGWEAEAPIVDPSFVRRSYRRGAVRITVTYAKMAMAPAQYEEWLAMSRAFPQATLSPPAEQANGFYQCPPEAPDKCDLLVQLRAGVHLEIRGDGTATRADLDALARALPLAGMAHGR